jgi:hypothetical protein
MSAQYRAPRVPAFHPADDLRASLFSAIFRIYPCISFVTFALIWSQHIPHLRVSYDANAFESFNLGDSTPNRHVCALSSRLDTVYQPRNRPLTAPKFHF